MFKKDVKIALFFTWFILTIICAATLVIPFLFSKDKVLGNTPVCISKSKYNQECMLCGSTTAFIEISEGNFKNAYNLNRGSVVIFAVFFINLCIFIIVAVSYRSIFFKLLFN
ncbi:hypothetical protein D3C87_1309180 [compost metagenome]|jgi:hypothetical protein